MNLTEQQIENQLRSAPRPTPPAGLRERLIAGVQLSGKADRPAQRARPGGWRRWWPALVPAAVSAACAVVLTLQQLEMRDIRENLRALGPQAAGAQVQVIAPTDSAPAQPTQVSQPEPTPNEEILRLRETARQLRSEVVQLEQMQNENAALRAQLASPQPGALTAEEQEALKRAQERAQAIACVNNLKQIGLAARVWGLDHQDTYPPDFLSMSNELSTPKLLVCAGDTNRQVAADWGSFGTANCSYEFLAPGGNPKEPNRILARCPIHGSIGLCDGSVQIGIGKTHPEQIQQRDGKWYLVPSLTR